MQKSVLKRIITVKTDRGVYIETMFSDAYPPAQWSIVARQEFPTDLPALKVGHGSIQEYEILIDENGREL